METVQRCLLEPSRLLCSAFSRLVMQTQGLQSEINLLLQFILQTQRNGTSSRKEQVFQKVFFHFLERQSPADPSPAES